MRIAHVEVSHGEVIILAAWMLDPVACASMSIGEPRISVAALCDLHQLLLERVQGYFLDSSNPVQENSSECFSQGDTPQSSAAAANPESITHDVRHSRVTADVAGATGKGTDLSRNSANAGRKRRDQGAR